MKFVRYTVRHENGPRRKSWPKFTLLTLPCITDPSEPRSLPIPRHRRGSVPHNDEKRANTTAGQPTTKWAARRQRSTPYDNEGRPPAMVGQTNANVRHHTTTRGGQCDDRAAHNDVGSPTPTLAGFRTPHNDTKRPTQALGQLMTTWKAHDYVKRPTPALGYHPLNHPHCHVMSMPAQVDASYVDHPLLTHRSPRRRTSRRPRHRRRHVDHHVDHHVHAIHVHASHVDPHVDRPHRRHPTSTATTP